MKGLEHRNRRFLVGLSLGEIYELRCISECRVRSEVRQEFLSYSRFDVLIPALQFLEESPDINHRYGGDYNCDQGDAIQVVHNPILSCFSSRVRFLRRKKKGKR